MNHRTFCDIIDSYYNSIEKVIIFVERWPWWCVITFRCDSSQKYLKIERWKKSSSRNLMQIIDENKNLLNFFSVANRNRNLLIELAATLIHLNPISFLSCYLLCHICVACFSHSDSSPRSFYEFQTAAAVGVKQPAFECSFAYNQARLIFKT